MADEKEIKNQRSEENTEPSASGGYQTPIDSENRTTAGDSTTSAGKPSAVPESASGDQPVEGAPNQGTERR